MQGTDILVNSPKNLMVRLRSNIEPLSPKLKTVATYIMENAPDVQFQTITDLARNTRTSEATVVRLCRDLGYRGYSDFRMALAVDLSQSAITAPAPTDGSVCDVSAQNAIAALEDTSKLIDEKAVERICHRIHQATSVNCVGVGASGIVSRYLSYRLLRVGKRTQMFEDTHLAAMSAVRSSSEDLWFAISSSGSTKEVIHAVTQAYKNDVPIVLLTNINHSPLASVASEILVAARPEGPLTGGAFASKVGACCWLM